MEQRHPLSDACAPTPPQRKISPKVIRIDSSAACQRIFKVLEQQPNLSVEEMAKAACVSVNALVSGGYLKALRDGRHIHISGWRWAEKAQAFRHALYSLGDLPDVPRPKCADEDTPLSENMRLVLAHLEAHPRQVIHEIVQATGLAEITALRSLRRLIKRKKAYIVTWRRASSCGPMSPVYQAGHGDNVPKPEAYDSTAKRERYLSRKGELSMLQIQCGALIRLAGARKSVVPAKAIKAKARAVV